MLGSRSAGNPHATWEREDLYLSQSARQAKGVGNARKSASGGLTASSMTRVKSSAHLGVATEKEQSFSKKLAVCWNI